MSRLAEPITALHLDNDNLFFGAISGYMGKYNITE